MPSSHRIAPPPPVGSRIPFPPVPTIRLHPASLNPQNIQTYRIDYEYGVYVMVSIDVNNFYSVFSGPGSYVQPTWLYRCDIYYSGSLQYTISDLSGIVWDSNNSYPFNDPVMLDPNPGVAFWTADQNIGANYFNLMSIQSLGYDNIYVIDVLNAYPCFKEGSQILTNVGYRPIETLRKGDMIQTYLHGFHPINLIGYRSIEHQPTEERIKDQLYQCSPSAYPEIFEDLVLTGAHGILVDRYKDQEERQRAIDINGQVYLTDGKARLPAAADLRTTVYPVAGTYTIWHLALDHSDYYMNYGIYANGLLVETCSQRYLKELSEMTLL